MGIGNRVPGATIFACESQPIVLEGLRAVLEPLEDLRLIGDARSLAEGLNEVGLRSPDIVVVDGGFGSEAILRFLGRLGGVAAEARAVVWAGGAGPLKRRQWIQAGAWAVADRNAPADAFIDSLRQVARGNEVSQPPSCLPATREPRLSQRELEVARLACQGWNNRQISEKLAISKGTVKVHLMHVLEKTGARDRSELAAARIPGGLR